MKFEAIFRSFLAGSPVRRRGWKKTSLTANYHDFHSLIADAKPTPVVVYRRGADEVRTENGFDLWDMVANDWELADDPA